MARPFYSAPVKLRPDFPLLPGQVRPPPPHALTGPSPPPPPPPGFTSDKPWMTPHLVAEIRRRNFLQNRAARSSCEQDRAAADQQRQLVNRLVNEAKERFCLAHPERTDEILASDRRARPFHCGSCDRSYGTQQQLDEHCREHVRCGLDDCPFTAHPRVVEKHVTMQHQTGLAKVIMALNTPEAIARWREQRRANFCRPESAARRQAEQAERAARGIRLSEGGGRRFPPFQERPGRGRGGGRGDRGRGRGRGGRPRPAQPPTPLSDSDEEEPRSLPRFAGILAEPVAVPGEAPTVDGAVPAAIEVSSQNGQVGSPPASGAVPAAMEVSSQNGQVGSPPAPGDESGSPPPGAPAEAAPAAQTRTEGDGVVSGAEQPAAAASTAPDTACAAAEPAGSEAGPASADRPPAATSGGDTVGPSGRTPPAQSVPDSDRGRGRGGRWRGRGRRGAGADQPPRKRRRPLTLLEKLLAPDIRRERNIILQCVRHIVNEKFFDGQPLGGTRATAPVVEERTDVVLSPAPETKAVPTPETKAVPTPETKAVPTPETKAVPTPETKAVPTPETKAVPTPEAEEPALSDAAPIAAQTDDEADGPVPRLLSGAYYDSDVITDSD